VRTVTSTLEGSSYFPSWTEDGRLSFRYDGTTYRGFMMATNVLGAPARALPERPQHVPTERSWSDIFPESPKPTTRITLVMIWSTWSAHSPEALRDLQLARRYFVKRAMDIGVLTATEPGSLEPDIARLMERHDVHLARIPLSARHLQLTEAVNQIPTTLLFRDGILVDRRLGAQTADALREWAAAAIDRGLLIGDVQQ
jgi:hypothetical protein